MIPSNTFIIEKNWRKGNLIFNKWKWISIWIHGFLHAVKRVTLYEQTSNQANVYLNNSRFEDLFARLRVIVGCGLPARWWSHLRRHSLHAQRSIRIGIICLLDWCSTMRSRVLAKMNIPNLITNLTWWGKARLSDL